jgi:hypothetical protein
MVTLVMRRVQRRSGERQYHSKYITQKFHVISFCKNSLLARGNSIHTATRQGREACDGGLSRAYSSTYTLW